MVLEEGAERREGARRRRGVRYGDYKVMGLNVCKGTVQSLGVGEGAIVRDCRGIGRIGVMCKVGIIDCSVSGE
jgi:hypothetical protein